ncbi:MAG: ATP-binding protein [Nitrospirae bacterium]|nr:ATP-binding protein [Nitrospirota bacterium]
MIKTNLRGRIRNTHLPKTKPLLPLFEAIINAIQSIEEKKGNKDSCINIIIERNPDLYSKERTPSIKSFTIEDDGVGFDENNYNSFLTSDTLHKIDKGGKGVGRFLWLKAFEKVSIESVYSEKDEFKKRKFDFTLSDKGVENDKSFSFFAADAKHTYTKIQLIDFKEEYQIECPKKLTLLQER